MESYLKKKKIKLMDLDYFQCLVQDLTKKSYSVMIDVLNLKNLLCFFLQEYILEKSKLPMY